MKNQINQQFKSNSKGKAIASLVLGIISSSLIFSPFLLMEILPIMELGPLVNFIFLRLGPLIAVIGLILGVMGLKSPKKNFAIAGIILCLIGLLVPLYYFLK